MARDAARAERQLGMLDGVIWVVQKATDRANVASHRMTDHFA